MKELFRWYLSGLLWIIKISAPLNLLVLFILVMIGVFNGGEKSSAVAAIYKEETVVLVGAGDHGRTYLLFPSAFKDPKSIYLTVASDGSYIIAEEPRGLFGLLGWLLLCGFGTWWFWLRKKPKD